MDEHSPSVNDLLASRPGKHRECPPILLRRKPRSMVPRRVSPAKPSSEVVSALAFIASAAMVFIANSIVERKHLKSDRVPGLPGTPTAAPLFGHSPWAWGCRFMMTSLSRTGRPARMTRSYYILAQDYAPIDRAVEFL